MATHYDYFFKDFQRKWFLERFGLNDFHDLIYNKTVIEIGTGSGAFLQNLVSARRVYGLDISKVGTDIARKTYSHMNHIKILNYDLMKYDGWPEEKYDVVIADQVLHHLPDTYLALEKASSLVKKGGQILFYVYKKKTPLREFMDMFLRFFTTRMPMGWCLNFSRFTCWLGKKLTKIDVGFQRWFYWNVMKCFWNKNFTYNNNLRINFDWYSPKIAHRHTMNEVQEWITKLELIPEFIDEGKSGISVRAKK
jgi:SAM-dependent methyltransferase